MLLAQDRALAFGEQANGKVIDDLAVSNDRHFDAEYRAAQQPADVKIGHHRLGGGKDRFDDLGIAVAWQRLAERLQGVEHLLTRCIAKDHVAADAAALNGIVGAHVKSGEVAFEQALGCREGLRKRCGGGHIAIDGNNHRAGGGGGVAVDQGASVDLGIVEQHGGGQPDRQGGGEHDQQEFRAKYTGETAHGGRLSGAHRAVSDMIVKLAQ